MFGSATLELAIGIAFIILLVSLMVTAVTELLASWLRWRAANLWKSLGGMLGVSAQEQLYAHPLVKTLVTPTTAPPVGFAWLFRLPGLRRLWPTGKGPSYIPARTFALALLDLVEQPYQAVERLIAAIEAAAADPTRTRQVAAAVASLASFPSLAASVSRWGPLVDELGDQALTSERLRTILFRLRTEATALAEHSALFDSQVQSALRPLMNAAGGDAERARAEVETWFNDTMDRASGWYKRKVQAVQVIVGLVLVIAMDVDVILLARVLWTAPTLRTALVTQAEARTKDLENSSTPPTQPEARFEQLRGEVLSLDLPVRGSCTTSRSDQTTPTPWWCDDIAKSTKTYSLGPLGPIAIPVAPLRWLGWLIAGVAASLGAPFWFDLLNKFMSIRGTGPPPAQASSQPKPSDAMSQRTA